MNALKNVKIIRAGKILPDTVLLFDTKIRGTASAVPEGVPAEDGEGLYCSAGFIDQHIHGYRGEDTMTHAPAGIAEALPANGVTAFLPTTMTMAPAAIAAAMERIRAAMREPRGARVLGCHMEGPFIAPEKKGAQDGTYILPPEMELIAPFRDVIKIVTYAPECDKTGTFAARLREAGIVPSLGHTGATYAVAAAAYENGAMSATHLFNAMPPLHHREPGVIGAVLEREEAYAELIADTVHVSPHLFPVLARLKPERLCLITDCMEAGGLPDGEYALGGQPVFVKGKEARLADGTLAGSVLRLNEGIANFARFGGVTLPEAVRFATENPARLLGLEKEMGTLLPGTAADFVLFDGNVRIEKTFVNGRKIYQRKS